MFPSLRLTGDFYKSKSVFYLDFVFSCLWLSLCVQVCVFKFECSSLSLFQGQGQT